jgi:competence protein ComEA
VIVSSPTPSGSNDGRGPIRTAFALIAVVLFLFVGAFLYAYRQNAAPSGGVVVTPSPPLGASNSGPRAEVPQEQPAEIVVHVAGAVAHPGVYHLPLGSRAVDAVKAAGGAAPEADTDALNLAAIVADGDQLVVPRRDGSSSIASETGSSTAKAGSPKKHDSPSGKLKNPGEGTVNINTANAEELQRLPGIGPAMAARVLAYRKEIGRFTAVEQLLEVSGIGEKRLAQLKPFVRIR